MAKKNAIGLKSILIGAIANDGGMGTSLTEVFGQTVKGSAVLSSTPVESTSIEVEETSDPIMDIVTGGGAFEYKWSSYNLDADALVAAFGGNTSGSAPNKIWEAPDSIPTIEKSIKAETANGIQVSSPRVSIKAELTFNFQKENPAQIAFTATVLVPTKASTSKLTIGTPAP
ncbi:MAG: hypothetical protein AAGB30_10970 [Pedobacter sp.]